MSRRKHHPPHRQNQHEQRLRAIVDALVQDDSQKAAYLAFLLELMSTMHHAPAPDFEYRTKRVVQKWFERGLHGKLLWLLGRAAMLERFR